jgi:hypothetical protein
MSLSMTNRMRRVTVFVVLLLAADLVVAQNPSGLSVDILNSKTMATQNKVEKLYLAGDFERAFFIYRNELAPRGDKYAQYMVGYMYMTGTGVEESFASASAWYQLAAERGTPEFVAARDELTRTLTVEQNATSNELYGDLRPKFCDLAVLMSLIKRDYRELTRKTGSRLGSATTPLTVVDPNNGRSRARSDYYGELGEQLTERLILLKAVGDFDDVETDPDKLNIRKLERQVEEYLRIGE